MARIKCTVGVEIKQPCWLKRGKTSKDEKRRSNRLMRRFWKRYREDAPVKLGFKGWST